MPRTSEPPELPGLDDGLRLLETEDRGRYAIHALVLEGQWLVTQDGTGLIGLGENPGRAVTLLLEDLNPDGAE